MSQEIAGNEAVEGSSVVAARRYCQDCIFIQVPATGLAYARCANPKAVTFSVGNEYVAREFDVRAYASSQRAVVQRCGPDAAWFEEAATS